MLLLTNEEVGALLDMPSTIEILERTYRALAEKRAINIPRADMLVPTSRPEIIHGFKPMSGSFPELGFPAWRINPDVISWPPVDGSPRRGRFPPAGAGR